MSIPTVTTVSPSSGPVTGGTPVTITGTGFIGATVVNFGVNPATSVIVVSDTTITCVSPSGNNTIDVSVTTPDGTSDVNSPDYFTYVNVSVITGVSPSIGPVAGGLPVVVTGDHLGYSNFVIKKDQANYDRGSTNPIYAKLTSILDGSLVTTGASVVVVTDSGSGNAGAGGSPIYNAPLWSYTPTEVETDGDLISFIFTALGAIPVTVRVATDVPIPISHNWYVSVAGDDSNDGTSWDRAFATIGQAMGVAFPGDTVCIGDGSFNAPYPYPDVGMQGNGITSLTLEGKLPLNGGNSLSNLSVINTTESSLQINNMGNPYVLTNVTAYGLIDCDLGGSVNKYPYVIANMCSFGSTYDLFNSRLSGQFSNCNFNSVYNGLSSSAVRCLGGGSAVNGGTRQFINCNFVASTVSGGVSDVTGVGSMCVLADGAKTKFDFHNCSFSSTCLGGTGGYTAAMDICCRNGAIVNLYNCTSFNGTSYVPIYPNNTSKNTMTPLPKTTNGIINVYATSPYPTNFRTIAVNFGTTPATSVVNVNPSKITCVNPSGNGTVDVTIVTSDGTTALNSADQFTYGSSSTGVKSASIGVGVSGGQEFGDFKHKKSNSRII